MNTDQRQHLNKRDIDIKAVEVLLHFDAHSLSRQACPLYEIVKGLKTDYKIPFLFGCDLGQSSPTRKILGRFDFKPRQILIDKILPYDSPRFRWTLAHEIGHLVLHRRLNPALITKAAPHFVDTREQLRFIRTAQRSELQWVEWQANQFASSLLLPQPILLPGLVAVQKQLEIPRPGWIYLDDRPQSLRDYINTIQLLAERMNVSKSMLRIRLINLDILVDARRQYRDHVQDALRALFSEAEVASDVNA